ncbi:MAG: hypothetical protein ACTSQJ_16150 [Promethearchaeota archaeon]
MENKFFSKINNQFLIFFIFLFGLKIFEIIFDCALFPRIHFQSYYYRIIDVQAFKEDINTLYESKTVNHLVYLFSFIYIHYPFSFLPLTYGYLLFIIVIGICYYFFFRILSEDIFDPLKQDEYLKLISYPIFLLAFADIYSGNTFGFQLLCLILSYKYIKDEKYIVSAFFYALALYKINIITLVPIFWSFSENLENKIKFLLFTIFWVILLNLPMLIFPNLLFDYVNAIFFTSEERYIALYAPFQPAHLLTYYPFLFLYFYNLKEKRENENLFIYFLIIFFLIIFISMIIISFSGVIFYLW